MRDYNKLISEIRMATIGVEKPSSRLLLMQLAADAIEELLAHACCHYHRNVHDRGDDSFCDVLNTEPPKEVE